MSAPGAQRVLPPAGGALNYFWLIPALAGINRGVSRSAERDSGLCPENPQPFEKGWRKLYFACGRDWFAASRGLRAGILTQKSYPQSPCAHCGRSCFSTTILHYNSTYSILILHFVFYFSAIYPQLSQVCTELSTDVHKNFRRNIHVFCWHLRHRSHRCRSRGH